MNEVATITPQQLTPDVVKQRICPQATDQEIFLFLQIAKSCNLNPFLNQIYLVKYGGEKAQILTSYNTYLQRAERTGSYAGLETSTDGKVEDGTLKAVVKVYRKDWERPLIHEVYYEEYVQKKKDGTPNRFWKEKPRTMIVKVAISQAFRLAFPLDFEGMPYTQDEMPMIEIKEEEKKTVDISKKADEKPLPDASNLPANAPTTNETPLNEDIITQEQKAEFIKQSLASGYTQFETYKIIETLGYEKVGQILKDDFETLMMAIRKPAEEYRKHKEEIEEATWEASNGKS